MKKEITSEPVNLLIFCPNCSKQHIDKAQPHLCEDCGRTHQEHFEAVEGINCSVFSAWVNPPHKTHRCHFCNHVWRPFEYPTNGVLATEEVVKALIDEVARLTNLINTPHTNDFIEAVPLEAAFQIEHWGNAHDAGKTPLDWFWLIGYLSQKVVVSLDKNDLEKAKHHCVSTAAVMLNWFRRICGEDTSFRPGTDLSEKEK